MNAKPLAVLILVLGAASSMSRGQANTAPTNDPTSLLSPLLCKDNAQSGDVVCKAVLPRSVDTKKSKVGDHIPTRVALAAGPGEQSIAMLDAAITYVQPAVKGSRSTLRIRIDKALNKDGHELPVQINIVALASQSTVTEQWEVPLIIADRFPRIPEDEQRLPGEKKLSEDQLHTSPLDATPDVPVLHTVICDKKALKGPRNACVDLLEARGIYGYKDVKLEPRDATSNEDSVLTSSKNIRLSAGTFMVLEVKKVQPPRKS